MFAARTGVIFQSLYILKNIWKQSKAVLFWTSGCSIVCNVLCTGTAPALYRIKPTVGLDLVLGWAQLGRQHLSLLGEFCDQAESQWVINVRDQRRNTLLKLWNIYEAELGAAISLLRVQRGLSPSRSVQFKLSSHISRVECLHIHCDLSA